MRMKIYSIILAAGEGKSGREYRDDISDVLHFSCIDMLHCLR